MKKTRTLHIGVNPLNLLAVMRRSYDSTSVKWIIDGDGWETWGEAIGTDANDDTTLHLSSDHPVSNKEARAVVGELGDLLMPMIATAPAGTLGVLTDPTDWSEDNATISLHRLPVLLETEPCS